MAEQGDDRMRALHALDEALVDAAGYLAGVDPELDGGHQTAREVLCHFVFWHREYVAISRALLEGREPPLKEGTYAQLNCEATKEFARQPMEELAQALLALEESLRKQLLALPDWSVSFPVKQDSRPKSVAQRVADIEGHVQDHLRRLRRADRLGEAWVRAYYPDQGE
jgi:hypothetical protein